MSYQTFSPNKINSYRVTDPYSIRAVDKEIIQDWTCNICTNLAFEPKICNSCSSVFCNECIQKFIQNCNYRYKCILKCKNTTLRSLNGSDKKHINKIKLKCIHNGCGQFISYTDYKNHIEKCQYRLYHCDNKPCKEQGYYHQMEKHSEKCKYRVVSCKGCKMEFKYIDKDNHFAQDCPLVEVKCNFCGISIKRVDYLNSHKSKDADCLKKLIKIKNDKLNEYEEEFKRLKKLNNEYKKIINENKILIKEQKNEINDLKNSKNILIKKNEDKRKTINELKQYFSNGLNKFNSNYNNKDNIDEVLNINNEINQNANANQNYYLKTQNNFYPKKDIYSRNTINNNNNYLTERRNYDRGMRRIRSDANFGTYRTINTEY